MKIYRYYCMNCGYHFDEGEVCFDLIQMLGLEKSELIDFVPITGTELMEIARKLNRKMIEGQKVQLQISVYDLLRSLGKSKHVKNLEALENLTYGAFKNDMSLGFQLSVGTMRQEAINQETENFVNSLIEKIEENVGEYNPEIKLNKCFLPFWIQPYFFEKTSVIRTIKYSPDGKAPNYMDWHIEMQRIRGYCPNCYKSIVMDSGQYRQYLIGVLGKQSSGKSNLFVAMLNELMDDVPAKHRKNVPMAAALRRRLGLKDFRMLADEQFKNLKFAKDLNANGWVVPKTDVLGVNRFNISVLAESQNEKAIVTLADIPGEIWNDDLQALDPTVLNSFPLILYCDAYILCASPNDRTSYSGGKRKSIKNIGNLGLSLCADQIYEQIKDLRKEIPPLCVVVTKIDLLGDPEKIEGNISLEGQNPFEQIKRDLESVEEHIQPENDRVYQIGEEVDRLLDAYAQAKETDNDYMLDALEVCALRYSKDTEHIVGRPYLSMIAACALGMSGKAYMVENEDAKRSDGEKRFGTKVDKENFFRDGDRFNPVRLDAIWDWIFRSIGLTSDAFTFVPSRGESYRIDGEEDENYRVPVRYSLEESGERVEEVYRLYVNPSAHDEELLNKKMECDASRPRGWLRKLFSSTLDYATESKKLVEQYLRTVEK